MSIFKNDYINFIKNNLLLAISIPVIFNSGINFIQRFNLINLDKVSFAKIISFILGTLFFVYLSDYLNNKFLFGGRSVALVLYLTSYFICDSVLMFVGGKMTFQSNFYITSLFWCVLILFKTKSLVGKKIM